VETPHWGIEPVPERLRVLGGLDTLLLWTNLSISLLVLVSAAYFELSLKQALGATLVGGLIGNAMLAVAALIGADARVPTMVLQRAPLGRRGSYLATGLNVLQCLGWSIFELVVIATAAGALSNRVFGFHAIWVWKLVFGAVALALALLGPIGFVRRWVRKIGVWAVLASIAYLAWWILAHGHLHQTWHLGGHHGSFWLGVDLVIALTVSWIPLVADYTRFSTTRRAAFWGTGIGYLLPTLFQFGFGAILVLSHPSINGPTAVLTTVAAGGVGSVLALLALTVDETDEAFANVYSTAVSLQNWFPRASQRALITAVAVLATMIALVLDLTRYQQFLLLLGAFFVPLFERGRLRGAVVPAGDGVRLARRLRGVRVDRADGQPRLLDTLSRPPPRAARRHRCIAAQFRRRVRPRARAWRARAPGRRPSRRRPRQLVSPA
jgi:NCS1 family nucleobase:cation symporter-1